MKRTICILTLAVLIPACEVEPGGTDTDGSTSDTDGASTTGEVATESTGSGSTGDPTTGEPTGTTGEPVIACGGAEPTSCVLLGEGFCGDIEALCRGWKVGGTSTFCDGMALFCANETPPCDLCTFMTDQCLDFDGQPAADFDGQPAADCDALAGRCSCVVNAHY